jgi:hypothetical protein
MDQKWQMDVNAEVAFFGRRSQPLERATEKVGLTRITRALEREGLGLGDDAVNQLPIDRLRHPHGPRVLLKELLVCEIPVDRVEHLPFRFGEFEPFGLDMRSSSASHLGTELRVRPTCLVQPLDFIPTHGRPSLADLLCPAQE